MGSSYNSMTLRKRMVAYCASILGLTMIHHTFNFYYVKVFLNLYHIQESWFHFAQLLFLIWNAVNDPLFAVFQDNANYVITRTRRETILYSAPFLALSYMIPWFQFGSSAWLTGVHLVIALCLYDTMFTFIGLATCCLFTEISTDPHDRLLLTRFSQVAGMLGHCAILLFEYTSNSLEKFHAFQVTASFVALTGMLLLIYTGLNAHTVYDLEAKVTPETTREKDKEAGEVKKNEPYWLKSWQILSDKNFIAFVITNFFQEFHKTYLSNFTAILCDHLISSSEVPVNVRSTFYGFTGILGGVGLMKFLSVTILIVGLTKSMVPCSSVSRSSLDLYEVLTCLVTQFQILVIFGTPVVGRFGYFCIIRCSFAWKICSGLVMYLIGPSNPWILMLFILLDTSVSGASYSLFNMPLSDISDQDRFKHNRKHPISSTVFGANALVVKPANSLSPMLVVAILNHAGYNRLKEGDLSNEQLDMLRDVMFKIVCFYPLVLGIIQMFTWSQFTLRRTLTLEYRIAKDETV